MADTTLFPSGQIPALLDDIRFYCDIPLTHTKWTGTRLGPVLKASFRTCLRDVYSMAMNPPVARFTVDTVANQEVYTLPPSIAEILRVAKINSVTGTVEWEITPRSFHNPYGPGILFEGGHQFRLIPTPQTGGDTLTVEYIPSGDSPFLHEALDPVCFTASTVQLPHGSTARGGGIFGVLDTDPNAYVGQFISLVEAREADGTVVGSGSHGYFPQQFRQISSYVAETHTVTVAPDFDFNPRELTTAVAGILVEVVPDNLRVFRQLVALHAARFVMGVEKMEEKYALLNQLYQDEKRTLMLLWANFEQRIGGRFESDVTDNPDY